MYIQSTVGAGLHSEIVPEVEKWLANASKKGLNNQYWKYSSSFIVYIDRETASKFIRTISSQGQRDDPATKASTHSSRVRSAVMTPSRQQRIQEKETTQLYKQLERQTPH